MPSTIFRDDIQILRAIAVTLVLLYHSKIPLLSSGFLGVDIFFVISGYLIAGIIVREINSATFSFKRFYLRRALRLLPAAYIVFIFVVLLSPLFLTYSELKDLFWQVVGALTFTSNIILWSQSGYFGGEAALKPLLHTWSLAIEEQFYLVLPVLLVLVRNRLHLALAVILASASLVSVVVFRESPSASFYLLPMRAWELLLGVTVAIFCEKRGHHSTSPFFYYAALCSIIIIPFFPIATFHPGPTAGLLCLATAFILSRQPHRHSGDWIKPVRYVGAISYSLYLVHWPLFSFLNNITFAPPWSTTDLSLRVGIILSSFALASALHHLVEIPFKNGTQAYKELFLFSGAPLILAAAYISITFTESAAAENNYSVKISSVCETEGLFSLDTACRSEGDSRMLVWGDSYAMHLIPGFADGFSSLNLGVTHATRSACGPFIGVAQTRRQSGYNQKWAEACIAFNDSVASAVLRSDLIDVVVLSSPFSYLIQNSEGLFIRHSLNEEVIWREASYELATQTLENTVALIRSFGKRVVIVAPPPSASFDMGRCGRRLFEGRPRIGVDKYCQFPKAKVDSIRPGTTKLLASVAEKLDVSVIDLSEATCHEGTCESVLRGVPLYADGGHLTREGSVLIASQLDLRRMAWDLAR